MTEKNITTKVQVLAYNELNQEDKNLVDLAKEATKSSYTPYSHFNVGAALLLDNGVMIKGANQENAAFAGICAERSACYNAGANYPGVGIKKVAITAFQNGDFVKEPCAPCGAGWSPYGGDSHRSRHHLSPRKHQEHPSAQFY